MSKKLSDVNLTSLGFFDIFLKCKYC